MNSFLSKILPWAPFLCFFVLFCVLKIIQIYLGETSVTFTRDLFNVLGFYILLFFVILLCFPKNRIYLWSRAIPLSLFFIKIMTIVFDDGHGFGDALQIFGFPPFYHGYGFFLLYLLFLVCSILIACHLFMLFQKMLTFEKLAIYGIIPIFVVSIVFSLITQIAGYILILGGVLFIVSFSLLTLLFFFSSKTSTIRSQLYAIFFIAIHLFFFKWIFAVNCSAADYYSWEYLWCHENTLFGLFDAFLFVGSIVLVYYVFSRRQKIMLAVHDFLNTIR